MHGTIKLLNVAFSKSRLREGGREEVLKQQSSTEFVIRLECFYAVATGWYMLITLWRFGKDINIPEYSVSFVLLHNCMRGGRGLCVYMSY